MQHSSTSYCVACSHSLPSVFNEHIVPDITSSFPEHIMGIPQSVADGRAAFLEGCVNKKRSVRDAYENLGVFSQTLDARKTLVYNHQRQMSCLLASNRPCDSLLRCVVEIQSSSKLIWLWTRLFLPKWKPLPQNMGRRSERRQRDLMMQTGLTGKIWSTVKRKLFPRLSHPCAS